MNSTAPALPDGVAIVGLAGRFPGARDVDTFWANLKAGVESISTFTVDELLAAGADPALVRDPAYVRARANCEGADRFDAAFFGYSPSEAAHMDPQQRVFLECAWEALEHAGYDPERYPGLIGLFAGHGQNSYLLANLCATREWIEAFLDGREVGSFQTFLGNDKDYLTSRVAYKLNLRGPAITVQTACSTSLVAVCQACQSLLTHQSDMALAGGVSIAFPEIKGYLYREGGITSPDGHCRAFDADARGTVFGSGAGVVLLKRVTDAVADGDQIYAIIRGSALNNDGSTKVSYTAPSVDGQAEAIATAQALAGVEPDSISYIEAHGTGTALGDPIEVAALTQAFRAGTDRRQFCALGSVKTNIGHLDAAAGVAGLIKTALALHHRQIPASLHYSRPNPQIDFASSPFFVNTALTPWTPPPGVPRRAGISSFGVGGTNAHVVLEEGPALSSAAAPRAHQVLLLSARSDTALAAMAKNLTSHLERHPAQSLADIAYTLQVGRREFPHRLALACRDTADAVAALNANDARRLSRQVQNQRDVPIVFLFPGQGAQAVNMGRELRAAEPVFREHLDRCLALASHALGRDLAQIIYPADAETAAAEQLLAQTQYTQPALFAIEYALAQLWLSWGIKPAAMIGHSLGEYVAACLSGVFSLEDAIALVVRRAQLVQALPGGAMLALRLSVDEARPWITAPLALAAVNAPNLCVISGPTDAIDALEKKLKESGQAGIRLKTSHAFHSAMTEAAMAPLADAVRRIHRGTPQIPWLSNVTGSWITAEEAANPEYWAQHLRGTVHFADSVAELLKQPDQILLEVGPGQTLTGLARQHEVAKQAAGILPSLGATKDDGQAIVATLGKLWLAGATPDWAAFHAGARRQRVPLPTYPFERKRCFVEPPRRTGRTSAATTTAIVDASPSVDAKDTPSLPAGTPRDRMATALYALFREFSGIELGEAQRSVPLVELGFDSLFLTQIRQSFQARFGVNITYRQLAESLNTIDALAAHLAEHAPIADIPSAAPAPERPASTSPAAVAAQALGPYHPPTKSATDPLTARQREWLDAFITRYTTRTARSKHLAAEMRPGVADPRSLANYRPLWKELVYQIVADESSGAYLKDVDGHPYLDVTMGFGANLFGHSPEFVTAAVSAQLQKGVHIGPQSPLTAEVAALIREFTGMERITFCNTGSEAVLAALRVARTVTRRSKVVYFNGDYHGLFDEVLMRSQGTGDQRASRPVAPGIPILAGADAIVLDYGKPETLETIRRLGPELAAVLVEPVQSRQPDLQPGEFLQTLRRITQESGTALIFDEVITGFRVHPLGAQGWFGVQADLATYGKVIGGGLPFGVLAGGARWMDALDGGAWNFGDDSGPEADLTFFAGTFVRHPLALAAALAVLRELKRRGPEMQAELNRRTTALAEELNTFFEDEGLAIRIKHFGSLFRFHFPPELPHATLLVYQLLARGIYFRDAHQNCFLSTAHTPEDLSRFVAAVKEGIAELRAGEFLPARAPATPEPAFALTAAQEEIWLASQLSPDLSRAYNQSLTLTLRGPLNLPALQAAWNQLLRRHPALRLTLAADGQSQQISSPRKTELPVEDWSAPNADERASRLDRLASEETSQLFDLTGGPLARARLIRLATDHHLFVFTAHHLVCDGESMSVVFRELSQLYSATVAGRAAILEPVLAFPDFARGESVRLASPAYAAAERYWLDQFATLPEPLELPLDHPRNESTSHAGSSERRTLPPALQAALKQVGAISGATLATTLLAAFALLLRRLSGQDEVVLGLSSAGRSAAGPGALVGHCVNLLPIRTPGASTLPVDRFLRELSGRVLDARDHEGVAYGRLVQRLSLKRESGRPPLIGALFNFETAAGHGLTFTGMETSLEANTKTHVNFELFLNIQDSPSGLILDLAYHRGVFEPGTIRRWLGHYETLLHGLVARPSATLAELPLLTATEHHRQLIEWNSTSAPFPVEARLHELFERQVRSSPLAPAVTDGTVTLNYAELNARADALARILRVRSVGPEVRVALCLERSVAMVVSMLAVLKAGGAYVPIDPSYPAERIAFMLADCGAPVLLTQRSLREKLPASPAQVIMVDDALVEAPAPAAPVSGSSRQLAYVIYTSGSTGQPKGVMVEHRAIVNHLTWRQREFPLGAGDAFLQKASCSFDISVWEIFAPLLAGARLVLARPGGQAEPGYLAQLIADERITDIHFGPGMLRVMLEDFGLGRCASLRRVFCGGEPMSAALQTRFFQECRAELISQYGPTETTVDATWYRCEATAISGTAPIGRPVANTQAYLLDAQFQPVPPGVAGELCIGGESLARGYLNRPELTEQKFLHHAFDGGPAQRLYRTGDRCRQRPDGVIEFLGRLDAQIKLRGFRIEPGEIETRLLAQPGVREALVLAREDQPGEPRLVAYIVPPSGASLSPDALRAALATALPAHLVPDAVVMLAELPRLPNGKLDRRSLPAPSAQPSAAPREKTPPSTAAEKALARIWTEVLGVDDIAADDSFLALGGHSLLAMRMAARVRSAFGIDLPMRSIFEAPTLAALAEVIEDLLLERLGGADSEAETAAASTSTR